MVGIGEPAVAPLIAVLAEQDWSDEVLADIGTPAVTPLVAEIGNKVATTRYQAVGALLQLYNRDASAVSAQLVDADLVAPLIEARSKADYGDERDTAAEAVLTQISKPAVKPLMALIGTEPWAGQVLAAIGADAMPDLTAALHSDDAGIRFGAADALVAMQKTNPALVVDFMSALEDNSLKFIADNYAFYIRLGKEGTEPTLVRALDKYGDKPMALDYLNCGNDQLETGAKNWADKHGYTVITQPGTAGGPQWGEGD